MAVALHVFSFVWAAQAHRVDRYEQFSCPEGITQWMCLPELTTSACRQIDLDNNPTQASVAELAHTLSATHSSVLKFLKTINIDFLNAIKFTQEYFTCQELCEKTVCSLPPADLPPAPDMGCRHNPIDGSKVCDVELSSHALAAIKVNSVDVSFLKGVHVNPKETLASQKKKHLADIPRRAQGVPRDAREQQVDFMITGHKIQSRQKKDILVPEAKQMVANLFHIFPRAAISINISPQDLTERYAPAKSGSQLQLGVDVLGNANVESNGHLQFNVELHGFSPERDGQNSKNQTGSQDTSTKLQCNKQICNGPAMCEYENNCGGCEHCQTMMEPKTVAPSTQLCNKQICNGPAMCKYENHCGGCEHCQTLMEPKTVTPSTQLPTEPKGDTHIKGAEVGMSGQDKQTEAACPEACVAALKYGPSVCESPKPFRDQAIPKRDVCANCVECQPSRARREKFMHVLQVIEDRNMKAQAFVARAMTIASDRSPESAQTKELFHKWYRSTASSMQEDQEHVLQILRSASAVLLSVEYRLAEQSNCEGGTIAYVMPRWKCGTCQEPGKNPQGQFIFYLCDLYMERSEANGIATLVHEASHHADAFTKDECLDQACSEKAYGSFNAELLAIKNHSKALTNADNFRYFVVSATEGDPVG